MKKILFLSVISATVLFLPLSVAAQSSSPDVIAAGGGFATGAGFTNSFTIGQGSLTETFAPGTFILTQGFQQPADLGTGLAPLYLPSTNIGTFPNPSNGQFFLEYNLDENAIVTVETYDVLGQRIYVETTSRTTGKQLHEVNLGTQANGIYFVKCTIKTPTGVSTTTSKITVSR